MCNSKIFACLPFRKQDLAFFTFGRESSQHLHFSVKRISLVFAYSNVDPIDFGEVKR